MDEPLFGGISRREMLIERFANVYIISISSITLAVSAWKSISTGAWQHILLGLCIAMFAAIEVRLVNWYRLGDLEPNFKYIIFALAFAISLLCIVAHIYLFSVLIP